MFYQNARLDEHSKLVDAIERYKRDRDAFSAGAQYALDEIVGAAAREPAEITAEWVDLLAATVLNRVHTGQL